MLSKRAVCSLLCYGNVFEQAIAHVVTAKMFMKSVQRYVLALGIFVLVLLPVGNCGQNRGKFVVKYGNANVKDGQKISLSTFQSGVAPTIRYFSSNEAQKQV